MDRDSLSQNASGLHARGLQALARRLVRDHAEADDVVQDAYLAALRRPPPPNVPLGRWLAGVVRNLARRRARTEGRRARHEANAPGRDNAPASDEVVSRAEFHRSLVNAVLALDEPFRTTVLLRYFDGLSLKDIAVRTRCPEGTAGRRLHEGLRRLRARLRREHGRVWPLVLTGALAMKKKLTAVAVLVALLATVFFVVNREGSPEARPDSDGSRRTAMSADDNSGSAKTGQPDEPVPAAAVDRDRDLHGVVVDEAGRPVAGATVATFTNPWTALGWDHVQPQRRDDGPATTSAVDGTFRIRLRRGEEVNLRAEKPGYPSVTLWALQAGARVRIVLEPGVRLTVLVLDPDGKPAAGARLRLQQLPPTGHRRMTGDATTDGEGRCTFVGLPPGGECHLFGRHDRFGRVPWEEKIVLPPVREHVITRRFRPGRTLRGVVKDARTGKPVANAEVDSNWPFGFPVKAEPDGTFVLHGWGGDKEFAVYARAPGYVNASKSVALEGRVAIALEPDHVLTGRVVDAGGRPVAGAIVRARTRVSATTSARGRATSGADGRFTVRGLPDGDRFVAVAVAGAGTAFKRVAAGDSDAGDIAVRPGRPIAGRVLWPDGKPAAGVKVKLESSATKLGDRTHTVTLERWTDDLGRFRFADVGAAAVHRISAEPAGGKSIVRDLEEAGEDIELRLLAAHRVTARVLFDDGRPVVGAQVVFQTRDKWWFDRPTDSEGRASAFSDTPFARVLRLYAFGRTEPFQFRGPVEIPAGATEVEVRVRRAGRAQGVILDPEGEPIAQANFEVFAGGKPLMLDGPFQTNQSWTDMQGRFELVLPLDTDAEIRLTSVVNRVSKSQKKLPPFGGRFEGIRAGRTDLVLRAETLLFDRPIVVRVLDPDGQPVPGAQVYAKHMGRNVPGANVLTNEEGRAILRQLPEAKCWINARLVPGHADEDSWMPASAVVEPEGQEITLQMQRVLLLRGVVLDADEEPVAEANVYAYHQQSELGRTKSDAQGRFAIRLRANQKTPIGLLTMANGKQKRIDPLTPKAGTDVRVVLE